jgi:L-lactate dehydrogenase complex protein LldG
VSAREDVLGRVRSALADRPPVAPVPRDYRLHGDRAPEAVRALFVERVTDYGATALVASDPKAAVAEALRRCGVRRVVVPTDLQPSLVPDGLEVVVDRDLAPAELDGLDGAVTTCAAACAETGTIALDGGPGQGRRAVTLVPDVHVCVVPAALVVETVPELIDALAPSARAGRPIVLVSGPSATSDIELTRVEGVHGPRRLVVIVAT